MTHHVILLNPSAGSVAGEVTADDPDSVRQDEEVAALVERLEQAGSVNVVPVEDDQDIRAGVEDLPEDSVIVIVGGDGTVHRVLNLLLDVRHPYLIVPAGTGNDFAGGIRVPEDMADAAGLASDGELRSVDLIDMGDRLAMNAAHVGIGVQAAERASGMKPQIGKAAYPLGALAAVGTFEPLTVSVTLDGEAVLDHRPISLLAVCNGTRVGGGTPLCPVADVGDGLLDLVVLLADTRAQLALTTAALVRGAHLERDDVMHRTGRELSVEVHGQDQVTWNIDGELLPCAPVMRAAVRPGAWQVFVPVA